MVGADGLRSDGPHHPVRRAGGALHRRRGVARDDPDGADARGLRARDRHLAGPRPPRDDLSDPAGPPDLQRVRPHDGDPARGVGPVGRPRRPAQLLRGRDGRRAGDHRPHHLGAHHADLLPRPAAGVGHRPDHPHGRRRPPDAAERGPGRRAGARGLRDARRVPAPRGRTRRRARGAGRVRRAPPGEDRVDAHLRADEPRDVQRARSDPAARTRRSSHRDAADGPGRRVDVRLALRPRRDRRRRAAAAVGERRRRRPCDGRRRSGRTSCGAAPWPSRTARGCGSASARATSASRRPRSRPPPA